MDEDRRKELGILEKYLKNAALRRKINEGSLLCVDGLIVLNDKDYVLIENQTPHLTEKGLNEISDITYGAVRRKEEQTTRLLTYYYKLMSCRYGEHKTEPMMVREDSVNYGIKGNDNISEKKGVHTQKSIRNINVKEKNSGLDIWKKDIIIPQNKNEEDSILDKISELYKEEHTFSEAFMMMLEMKNIKGPECYNKAGVNRNIYSKLQRNRNYVPTKSNCISLCFGMDLCLTDTEYLLKIGGYALGNILFDRICSFFLGVRNFDVISVNETLKKSDCNERLGSKC